jgi:hypothetical protein
MNSFYPSQGYPQTAQNVANNEAKAERQCWGQTLSVIFVLLGIFAIISLALSPYFANLFVYNSTIILANVSFVAFHLLAIFKSDYLKGKPSFLKLLPLLALPVLCFIVDLVLALQKMYGRALGVTIMISLIINGIKFSAFYFMYSADDDSGSCCLCSKPWIHKRAYNPYDQKPYMPPQGFAPYGYAPQGYPSRGYAPQGYPTSYQPSPYHPQQGYPPQGQVPQQGHPPQGQVSQQGHPTQSQVPQQGAYAAQGYPPQNASYHPQQGYPPQGQVPQQGYPPQGQVSQQGHPTQSQVPQQGAYAAQGYPPQGQVPQQGYPPQGQVPQQGYPPQGQDSQKTSAISPQILQEKNNP